MLSIAVTTKEAMERNKEVYVCFIDMAKTLD